MAKTPIKTTKHTTTVIKSRPEDVRIGGVYQKEGGRDESDVEVVEVVEVVVVEGIDQRFIPETVKLMKLLRELDD